MKTVTNQNSKNPDKEAVDQLSRKVSLEQLRKIWNDEEHSYSDEELTTTREWLYVVANIIISVSKRLENQHREEKAKIVSLKSTPHETQSDTVHQSEYRRAS